MNKKKIKLSELHSLKKELRKAGLHTVCEEARCPNISECFKKKTATFMVMGNICTRNCKFCNIRTGKPLELDIKEPVKVAETALQLKLKHIVVTSVTRDDLADGGANHFALTINQIKNINPYSTIEVLTPDFNYNTESLNIIINSKPDVFNHNIETVESLSEMIRPQASYQRSLDVLKYVSKKLKYIKSGFMLGLGENNDQISQTINDIYKAGVNILTIGQYYQPSLSSYNLSRMYTDEEFNYWADYAKKLGFSFIFSGRNVRSSYLAEELLNKLLNIRM